MDRKYCAFISYRHLPLDTAVAEKIHKLIEHYRVPKDLRKNSQSSIGLVFRDRDELPLTSNLTADIYTALENSDYLIVVCTPDTPKSLWVRQEIEHFIKVHGRERILTVLAAGTVAESVPDCITTVYDTDGKTVLQRIEPLCAYLVDDMPKKVMRNLRSEFLRLAAAIIGCPYDSLKQRQKRYRAQQAMWAMGAVFLVALAIIAMLVQWNMEVTKKNEEISGLNRQIQSQLEQTQLNESMALTLLSENHLSTGNRIAAIQNALAALEGDRPYYAPAEAALADALYVYQPPQYLADKTFDFPDDFSYPCVAFSPCGRYAIIDDINYAVLYDLKTWEEKWRVASPSSYLERYITIDDEMRYFVMQDPDFCYILSFETGEILYEFTDDYWRMDTIAFSPQSDIAVVLPRKAGGIVVLFNADTREEFLRFTPTGTVYRGDFSDDGKTLLLFGQNGTDYLLYLIDLSSGKIQELPFPESPVDCAAMPNGEYILLSETDSRENIQYQFWKLRPEELCLQPLSEPFSLDSRPTQMLSHDQWLYCIMPDTVRIYSNGNGVYAGKVSLSSLPIDTCADTKIISPDGALLIALHDGICKITSRALYDGSLRWSAETTSIPQLERVFCGNGRIAYTTALNSDLSFLQFFGDANAAPLDGQQASTSEAPWNITADFDGKMLIVKDNNSKETQEIPCPYETEDSLYLHRSFMERYMENSAFGSAELYYKQNGIIIAGYYEGGYSPTDPYDFDAPEAYMIYSVSHGSWNRFENEALQDPSLGIFFMSTKPGFAIVSGTNTLQIYDFASNAVILTLHPELTYLSGVRFSQDDRYLLAFDSTTEQSILYDLTDGTVLLHLNELPYLYSNDFYLFEDANKLFMGQFKYPVTCGIILDIDSQTVLVRVPNMVSYNPDTRQIICKQSNGTYIAYPAYSTQDLIEIAKKTLADNS